MTITQRPESPRRFSFTTSTRDGVHVVSLRGEIDHDATGIVDAALVPGDGAGPGVVVDLAEVTFMDSSGINILVTAYRNAIDTGGWLRIAGAQSPVLRVLQLVGVDTIIACHPDVDHALRS
ncbi:STAS domain-containing protein [Streptomyces sp. t39]|uniref:STAS domain-containing protein n=1 Tax=Streptomyces sp. t39 TaxID=1828156 RepID=UPI0021CA031D|nr:STAS domain-containing protein [Streptomyces sp. t39]